MLAAAPLSDRHVELRAAGGVGELAAVLALHGFATFDGVPGEDALVQIAGRLGQIVRHRDSGSSGITVVADRGQPAARPGQAGFTAHALAPHTDCSDQQYPAELVLMTCVRSSQRGGECVIADGQAVYSELAAVAPDALVDLSAPRSALFGGSAGLLGAVFEPCGDGLVGVRLRLDELARFAPQAQRWIPLLRRTIDRCAFSLPLPAGAGYIVNNRRFLHGRRAFSGHRTMCRALVRPRPAWRIPAGFAPLGEAAR
ncbi:TauD/TfdA family dioxygenase [Kutzneria sp. CA-103260]|uniref:TauD/TfdA family dioxygenase n=1 Tax=Kutzneria sp. CA-103260 TaxID=2802641 RepID=UPI001BA64B77|nr:TauD/TfdA family dioxygenase [Kutzneria sp. CA-103260]QUQ72541.1 Taurine catabolism dioxygenase TauD, TfdA family [Kutzneria sp. CA-103260]